MISLCNGSFLNEFQSRSQFALAVLHVSLSFSCKYLNSFSLVSLLSTNNLTAQKNEVFC